MDGTFARLTLRDLTFPEEDRHLYTTEPWVGGFRWFRSPNVIALEQWRVRKKAQNKPVPTPTGPAQCA
jgi:hypothetical protein